MRHCEYCKYYVSFPLADRLYLSSQDSNLSFVTYGRLPVIPLCYTDRAQFIFRSDFTRLV